MSDSRERVLQVKDSIEHLKGEVLDVQNRLSNKNMADSQGRRLTFSEWNKQRQELKSVHSALLARLRAEKQELRTLSGTTGVDPKWDLVKKAYVVLSALDEKSIDIGAKGRELLDEIEFHVPMAKLQEAMENSE